MKRITLPTLAALAVGLALVLSGCSTPTSPLRASSAPAIAGLANSGNAQLLGLLQPSQTYAPVSLNGQSLATTVAPMAAGPCVASSSWGADVDLDNAPVSGTITYGNCPAGSGVTASGTFTIADNNDNSAYSGFHAQLANFTMTVTGTAVTTLSMNATLDVNRTSTTPSRVYAIDYQLSATLDNPSVNGSLDVSGTPTFTSSVTSGPPFQAGTFDLSGQASFNTSNGFHYSLTRTGTAVVDQATCAMLAATSDVTYKDSKGNSLELAYTGCGTGTFTFIGASGNTATGSF